MLKTKFKYISGIEIIFPVAWVNKFSANKKFEICGIFIVSMFLSFLGEYLNPSASHFPLFEEFFRPSTPAMVVLKEIGVFIYSPYGHLITINLFYFVYIFILYCFIDSEIEVKYFRFLLPFLFLSILGIFHGLLKVIGLSDIIPNITYWVLLGYILIFYYFLLFRVYKIKIIKSLLIVYIPFELLALLFGATCIAPYLA